MRIAILGASGKTGVHLVREGLRRGHQLNAVFRNASAHKLDEFKDQASLTLFPTKNVSDEATLSKALDGCDAVVTILISVHDLKATELITSLSKATAVHQVTRLVFTAGEITVEPEEGEGFTLRQKLLKMLGTVISWVTPYSVTDMLEASRMIHGQTTWNWTILRAPTLTEASPVGYQLCALNEVTSKDSISREDYAASLLDSICRKEDHRKTLTAVSCKN